MVRLDLVDGADEVGREEFVGVDVVGLDGVGAVGGVIVRDEEAVAEAEGGKGKETGGR